MMKDYFVMLNTQNGGITPLMAADDEIATFETPSEAKAAGKDNLLGAHFGFEVFGRGEGHDG
jgi:hypothetical protein